MKYTITILFLLIVGTALFGWQDGEETSQNPLKKKEATKEAQGPDSEAPKVTITSPTTSTVSRKVEVNGDALDNQGVVKVELYVGKNRVATVEPKGPTYTLVWDSNKATLGAYNLTVKAYDAAGNAGSASVKVHVRRQFNVKKFGAKGDGKADDSKAIQATLAAAQVAGGGTVYLPEGTYTITPNKDQSIFMVASNVEVRGDGPKSVLKIRDNVGDYNSIFGPAIGKEKNLAFRHFAVHQNPAGNQTANIREKEGIQNIFQFNSFENVTVQSVHFDPICGVQAIVLDGPPSSGVVIDSCFFRFKRGKTQHVKPPYDHSTVYIQAAKVLVRNNTLVSELKEDVFTAIELHGGPDMLVERNQTDFYQVGVLLIDADAQHPEVPNARFVVRNNQIRRTGRGVSLWSGRTLRGAEIRDNLITMTRCLEFYDMWLGVYLHYEPDDEETYGSFEDLQILNNTIDFTAVTPKTQWAAGIELSPVGRVKNVVVKGNTILSSPCSGIRVGNSIPRFKKGKGAAKTLVDNTCENILIEGNVIENAGWDPTAAKASRHNSLLGQPWARSALVLDRVPMINVRMVDNVIRDTGKVNPRGFRSVWAFPAKGSSNVMLQNNQIQSKGRLRQEVDRVVELKMKTKK